MRQLDDDDGAMPMHLVGKLLPTLGKSGILIGRLMTTESPAQRYLVGRPGRQRHVEQPRFAADPPRAPTGLGAMMRDEMIIDQSGSHRRVDGVGCLAYAVRHTHRAHLQWREQVLEFHACHD